MMVEQANWYRVSAGPREVTEPLTDRIEADVAIVGGGFTGLSAALELAKRGYRTVVLESKTIGWGASGRNGGQIATAYNPSMAQLSNWVGKEGAKNLWDMAQEAKDLIRQRVDTHGIDCDLKSGTVIGALKPRHERELRETLAEWGDDYGYQDARWVDKGEIGSLVDCPRYTSGVFDGGGGHLHPLNYAQGLAKAAQEAGAQLFENSEVIDVSTGANPSVTTNQGRVDARYVILAGNAYLPALGAQSERIVRSRIMPVGTYIIATEPLDESTAHRLMGADAAVLDCNFVLNYYRLSADRRMLFGGKVSYSQLEPPNLAASLRRTMVHYLPSTADLDIEYCWGGNVAITINRTPHFGRLADNVYFAHGFSGHGVALTGMAGLLMAEAIAGTAERFDVFARIPHRAFPGGQALRMPALVLAMIWYRLRDLL